MTDSSSPAPQPARPRRAIRALAGAAVAILAGAVVYGLSVPSKEGAAECAPSAALAARLAPLAKGEVAAMQVDAAPSPLPALSFLDAQGARKTLADFKGETLLVNLWATWCVPCRAEMPSLDRLEAREGGANFQVVAINIDTARLDRRKAFLDSIGVKSLAFYADPSADAFQALKAQGRIVGLPTSYLVDPSGCALATMAGPADWMSEDARKLIAQARATGA